MCPKLDSLYNEKEERKGLMKERRRMISEAARELGLETYNLRTWEDEFGIIIPRNEKGYRCYGDQEIHTFKEIRDMKNDGIDTEQIKKKLSGNIIPFPGETQVGAPDKMAQFQNVMVKIMGQAIREQKDYLGKEIGSQISVQVSKEMDYQLRTRDEKQETYYQKLDEMIRMQQKTREEIAASREKKGFFRRKRKER